MQAGDGLLTLTWRLYNDHFLDIVMNIWKSLNCPIVICLPTVCYFSWEKPLVKSTAPGLFFIIFAFAIYFYLLLFSDLLNQKYKNTLLQFLVIYFISRSREIYLSNLLQFYLSFYPWGIDNPTLTLGCKYLFFVCRSCLRGVAWFSYWFDNLGFITEGNTYRRCATSSLPLQGNTDVVPYHQVYV